MINPIKKGAMAIADLYEPLSKIPTPIKYAVLAGSLAISPSLPFDLIAIYTVGALIHSYMKRPKLVFLPDPPSRPHVSPYEYKHENEGKETFDRPSYRSYTG